MILEINQEEWLLLRYAVEKKIDILLERAKDLGTETDQIKAGQLQNLLDRIEGLTP